MKKNLVHKGFFKAITSFVTLSIIVIAVGFYFVFDKKLIGPVFLILGVMSFLFLKFLKIKIKLIYPDLVFGFTDNSIMVFAVIIGGSFGGIPGAIIGGVAGNTITDGIGGLFEGYVSERLTKGKFERKRTALSSSLGKMTGCMFGAGFSLTIVYLISLIF